MTTQRCGEWYFCAFDLFKTGTQWRHAFHMFLHAIVQVVRSASRLVLRELRLLALATGGSVNAPSSTSSVASIVDAALVDHWSRFTLLHLCERLRLDRSSFASSSSTTSSLAIDAHRVRLGNVSLERATTTANAALLPDTLFVDIESQVWQFFFV